MHAATVFFALAVVASASAVGIANDLYAVPHYRTSYSVSDKSTGDQKSAYEVRDGGVTKGSYSLVQPDGVVRTVKYIVTPGGGFQAQVLNNGVSAHPTGHGIGGAGWGINNWGLGGSRSVVGGLGAGIGGGWGINNWGGARSVVEGFGTGVGGGWGINNWGGARSVVEEFGTGVGGGWGINNWGGARSVVGGLNAGIAGGWGINHGGGARSFVSGLGVGVGAGWGL